MDSPITAYNGWSDRPNNINKIDFDTILIMDFKLNSILQNLLIK